MVHGIFYHNHSQLTIVPAYKCEVIKRKSIQRSIQRSIQSTTPEYYLSKFKSGTAVRSRNAESPSTYGSLTRDIASDPDDASFREWPRPCLRSILRAENNAGNYYFGTRSSRPHPCWSSGLPATQRTGVNFAGWFAIGRPCNRLMWDLTLLAGNFDFHLRFHSIYT